jgi:hypothetical protein
LKLHRVGNNRIVLSKRGIFYASFLIFLVVVIYGIVVNVGAGKLDLYGATIYYYNWADEISKLGFSFSELAETYTVTLKEISAPEPIPGILVYFITSFIKLSTNVFHFINLLVLILFAYFIKNTIKDKVIFFLMFLAVATGYYEYVLLHMVHRFKISILFLMLSLYFFNKKQGLSNTLYIFSLLSHFSMITTLPLVYFLRRLGFTILPTFSSKKLILTIVLLLIVYIPNILDSDSEYLTYIFFTKFNQSSLSNEVIYAAIFLLVVYGISKKLLNKFKNFGALFWLGFLFIYLVLSLSIIGTSRLLMVYYIWFLLIYLANYTFFSPKQRITIFIFFSPLFFYNFINGFIKGPVTIVYDVIF